MYVEIDSPCRGVVLIPTSDYTGRPQYHLRLPGPRLLDKRILGYLRRAESLLRGLLPRAGVRPQLALGTSLRLIVVYPLKGRQVSWLGNAEMPLAHIIKIEDARTGQWLRHLDPVTDPIHRIDMGWTMGDWNQLDVTVETVALRTSSPLSMMIAEAGHVLIGRRLVQAGRMGAGATRSITPDLARCGPTVFT